MIMRIDNINAEQLDKIKKTTKIDDFKIYLRPKYEEFGSAAAPSRMYDIQSKEVIEQI